MNVTKTEVDRRWDIWFDLAIPEPWVSYNNEALFVRADGLEIRELGGDTYPEPDVTAEGLVFNEIPCKYFWHWKGLNRPIPIENSSDMARVIRWVSIRVKYDPPDRLHFLWMTS